MKKLFVPVFALVLSMLLIGPVPVYSDCQRTFSITGYTTNYEYDILPSGLTRFQLTAQGGENDAQYDPLCQAWATQLGRPDITTCADACLQLTGKPCGVSGDITGSFAFRERGIVDLNPETFEGSGDGVNNGRFDVLASGDTGTINFGFTGKTDSVSAWGTFRPLRGTGDLAGLQGKGHYSGNAGLIFTVEFTGRCSRAAH